MFGEPNRMKHAEQVRANKSGNTIINLNLFCLIDLIICKQKIVAGSPQAVQTMRQSHSNRDLSPEHQGKKYIKHVTKDLIREIL